MTLNEPQVFTIFGYLTGVHAPGTIDIPGYMLASHHTALAHGRAVQALRAVTRDAKLGIVEQVFPIHPMTPSDEDRAAAYRVDGLFNRWFLDPLLKGSYPEDMLSLLSFLPSPIQQGDLEVIRSPIDFVGVNHYTRQFARHDPNLPLFEFLVDLDHREPGSEYTEMAWEVHPPSFAEVLARLRTEYGNPLVYVTENGAATLETVEPSAVHDPARQQYIKSYLGALHGELTKGSRVGGYFVWSLTDNFEWAFGYAKHFGLIHVDYETQRRVIKDSGRWYADVIRQSGF
jgi:beta-glucosidase